MFTSIWKSPDGCELIDSNDRMKFRVIADTQTDNIIIITFGRSAQRSESDRHNWCNIYSLIFLFFSIIFTISWLVIIVCFCSLNECEWVKIVFDQEHNYIIYYFHSSQTASNVCARREARKRAKKRPTTMSKSFILLFCIFSVFARLVIAFALALARSQCVFVSFIFLFAWK